MMDDLFPETREQLVLSPGAVLLGGFARAEAQVLLQAVESISQKAPFRHYRTAGGGVMAAGMTACGPYGWVSDGQGYRYMQTDPLTGQPWPAMPALFADMAGRAARAAGYEGFVPQCGLVNRYAVGAGMGLHQDRDERTMQAPVVSVSLGLSALFLWGGALRGSPCRKVPLHHGDVVVWGGPSRCHFHGVAPIRAAPAVAGLDCRYNLTFRVVDRPFSGTGLHHPD